MIIKKAQKYSFVSVLDGARPLGKEALKAVKGIRDEWG